MLDAAGWTRRGDATREKGARKLSFLLMYPASDSVRKDIALAFSSQMQEIGVDVRLQGLSFDVIQTRQDKGATEFGYGVPYDPDLELYTLFDSRFASDGVADTAFTNYPRCEERRGRRSARGRALEARSQRAPADFAGSRRRSPTTRAGCGSCACATSS